MIRETIYIFHASDFQTYPVGGTIGTIRNFLYYTEFECLLVGLTNNPSVQIGKWVDIDVRGKKFKFLPIGYSKKEVIPHKILMLLGIIIFRQRIFEECKGEIFNALFYVDRQCHTVLKLIKPKKLILNSFYKMTDATNPLITSGRRVSQFKPLQTFYFNYFFKPLLLDSKLIFSINDDCRSFCEQTLKKPEDQTKIRHLNHFVDYEILKSLQDAVDQPRPKKGIKFIFWGRIVKVKGLKLMFDAIKSLSEKYPGCELTVIGDGEDRPTLENYVSDQGLASRIQFAGKKDIRQIAAFSKSADIFLMSSYSEGIPTAMLEAMVFGLPVVSTEVGGISTLISQGVNGFLVANRNPDDYREAVEKALALDRSMVLQYNRELIQNHFSARAIVGEMDRLFRDAIA